MATEAPPAPPPAAPPAATPPAPAPAGEIHVIPQPVQPAPPPKKGSVMDQMMADMERRAGDREKGQTPKAAPEPKPGTEITGDETPPTETTPPTEVPTEVPEAGKKPNPWKIVDTWKARAAAAEAKLAEAAANAVNPAEKAKLETRLSELETRNKELAEEIKYEAYVKSPEFKENFEKPYEAAWNSAMTDLGELTVIDGPEERPVTTDDILNLVKLKLGPAMEEAKEKFGDFAGEAMRHRKVILDLFNAKQKALTDARTNTEQREAQITQQREAQMSELQGQIQKTWAQANEMALADERAGKFFKPVEGDDENNKRLENGYKMVDAAWSGNAFDPRLNPKQREDLIKAQAAVRHRAAAFGRVVATNHKLETENQELKKRLSEYEDSTPPAGGSSPAATRTVGGSVMEQMFADLEKRAK